MSATTDAPQLLQVRIRWDMPREDRVIVGLDNGGWCAVEEMQISLLERWANFNPVKINNGIKYRLPHYERTHYVTLEGGI